jgi:DNA gyrase subunit B
MIGGHLELSTNSNSRNLAQLENEDQVRKRPAVIFGTNLKSGAFSGFMELVANSVDEAREGHGDLIKVTVEEGDIITVEDSGRGLPMDWNENAKKYNWELALCTLYASGKLDASQYQMSLGLNGLGLTATQFASSFMEVWSTYDGTTKYMKFEKGRPIGKLQTIKPVREHSGTIIKYKPDPEVFPELNSSSFEPEMFLQALTRQAMLLAGLKIEFSHHLLKNTITLYFENGITDYIEQGVVKPMLNKVALFEGSAVGTDNPAIEPETYKVDMRLAFTFSRESKFCRLYHNASHLFEGGSTVDALQKGMTQAFTEVARAQNKLNKADRFQFKDIEEILFCIGTTDAPGNRTAFKNQTKGAITNPFIGDAYQQFVYEKIKFWLDNNNVVANRVIAEVVTNKRAREEATEVSKKVIRSLTTPVTFGNKPQKFVDCTSKDPMVRELYIVEGDSALGSVKLARNSKTQAIIPVRGKIINCLKEKPTRVLSSEVIRDIFRVLGCGIELKSKYIQDLPKFDMLKLNFSKIVICTDADIDGFHIRTLLLTMFYRLCPSLLKAGKVFIADTPLYTITWRVNKKARDYKFAYNDTEKESILEQMYNMGAKDGQIKIERSKGLGENDPDMMSVSTMHPNTRRLISIEYPEDDTMLRNYFDALLGDDLEARRELVEAYFDTVQDAE